MLTFERQAWEQGYRRVAGVDEAGRGPLAGPVVAAAVVFPRPFLESEENGALKGLTDSKKLTDAQRRSFYALFAELADIRIGVGCVDAQQIDKMNILRATHLAMAQALQSVVPLPDHAIVDGLSVPGLPCSSTAIIKGDQKSLSIAAASVVAKVTRDNLMNEMDGQYPQYGFAGHKGYGSKSHIQALLEYGPSLAHRYSFRPVREAAAIREWMERNGQRPLSPSGKGFDAGTEQFDE